MAEDERVDLLSFTGSTPVGFHNYVSHFNFWYMIIPSNNDQRLKSNDRFTGRPIQSHSNHNVFMSNTTVVINLFYCSNYLPQVNVNLCFTHSVILRK